MLAATATWGASPRAALLRSVLAAAGAEEAQLATRTRSLEHEIRILTERLGDRPPSYRHAESAMAMKAQVRKLLELGYSRDQVLEYFEGSYGEFVRLVPKVEGLNLLVWAAPAIALIGGAALITWNRKASGEPDLEELERYRDQVRREL